MERRVITGLLAIVFIFVGLFAALPQKTHAVVDVAAACAETFAMRRAASGAKAAAAATDSIRGVATAEGVAGAAITGAQAGADEQNATKEGCLDAIFFYIAKIVVHKITQSTIAWINGGFQGKPSFIDNPGEFFGDVVNEELLDFIETVFPSTGPFIDFLCTPHNFQFDLKLKFILKFGIPRSTPDEVGCTLTDIGDNISTFADSVQRFYDGKFTQGGWSRWFEVTQNTSNNPFALEYDIESKFIKQAAKQLGLEKQVADWGDGFKSVTQGFEDAASSTIKKITLPGKFIEGQLGKVFGSSIDQLNLADEFNEIVAALFSQLLSQVLQKGFSGVARAGSSPADSNGSRSYSEDLYNPNATDSINEYNDGRAAGDRENFGDAACSAADEADGLCTNDGLPTNASDGTSTSTPPSQGNEVDPERNIARGAEVFVVNPSPDSYGNDMEAWSLTDGSVSGNAEYRNVITDRGMYRSVQIRLDRTYNLGKIEVYERPGAGHPLRNFWIFISDQKITATTPQAINALTGVDSILVAGDGPNGQTSYTIDGEYAGRYIMVMRADPNPNPNNNSTPDIRLELNEIMAYEREVADTTTQQ